ncbi:hypothetical protein PAMP_010721 [Pampus punctatissimus]
MKNSHGIRDTMFTHKENSPCVALIIDCGVMLIPGSPASPLSGYWRALTMRSETERCEKEEQMRESRRRKAMMAGWHYEKKNCACVHVHSTHTAVDPFGLQCSSIYTCQAFHSSTARMLFTMITKSQMWQKGRISRSQTLVQYEHLGYAHPLAPHVPPQPAESTAVQTNCERSGFWLGLETGVISFDRADELLIKCLSESGICRKTNVC